MRVKEGEVTVKVNVEMLEDAQDLIRQIVREEIAALIGRLSTSAEVSNFEGIDIQNIYGADQWRKVDSHL